MRRALTLAPLLAAVLAFATSCTDDTPPPPEGFHLNLRFMSLDPTVLDRVEVTFQAPDDTTFMMVEPMSYADGAITLEVTSSITGGPPDRIIMTLRGDHVAAVADGPRGDGSYMYDLEVFSNDETERSGMDVPGVRITALRGGEVIAEGFAFMPDWPPPLGQTVVINVPCRPGATDRCTR